MRRSAFSMSVRMRDTRDQCSDPAKHNLSFTLDSLGSFHALQMACEKRGSVIDPQPLAELVFILMLSSHIS